MAVNVHLLPKSEAASPVWAAPAATRTLTLPAHTSPSAVPSAHHRNSSARFLITSASALQRHSG